MAAVHEAAVTGNVEALRALLDTDEHMLGRQRRPLHYACEAGSVEAVRLLLERGAEVDRRDAVGCTGLMEACQNGHWSSWRFFWLEGPTLHERCFGATPLMFASFGRGAPGSGHIAVMRLLLKDGRVAVDDCDYSGYTALSKACFHGCTERARVLLMEGRADHTIANRQGATPMAVAQQARRPDCVQLLQWYEGELERAFLLSKARAMVDDTESIDKATEKAEARTEAEAQQAREEAAPAYLCGRVGRGEALLVMEVVGQARQAEWKKQRAVLEYVLRCLKEDLFVELMGMLRYR